MAKDELNGTAPEAEAKNYPPLEMEATVRIPAEQQKNLLGYANVTFNGTLTVTDFKVLKDGDGNLFAAMPSKSIGGGKYAPTAWLKTDEAKAQLQETVLTAYDTAVQKLKARAAELTGEKPAPVKEQFDKAAKQAAEHNAKLPPKDKGGKEQNAEH